MRTAVRTGLRSRRSCGTIRRSRASSPLRNSQPSAMSARWRNEALAASRPSCCSTPTTAVDNAGACRAYRPLTSSRGLESRGYRRQPTRRIRVCVPVGGRGRTWGAGRSRRPRSSLRCVPEPGGEHGSHSSTQPWGRHDRRAGSILAVTLDGGNEEPRPVTAIRPYVPHVSGWYAARRALCHPCTARTSGNTAPAPAWRSSRAATARVQPVSV